MTTMLMMCLSAGSALGLVANVFRLLALSLALAVACFVAATSVGRPIHSAWRWPAFRNSLGYWLRRGGLSPFAVRPLESPRRQTSQ